MILRPTVFVLGAGASVAVGYPTGAQLVDQICTKVKNRQALFSAAVAAGFSEPMIDEFRDQLYASNLTVDNFLAVNHDFLGVGRFAIAYELIAVEDEEVLKAQGRTSWYRKLRLVLGNNLEELRRNRVTIITFNYDRSLNQFLYQNFHASGGRTSPDPQLVAAYLRNLGLVHVHGSLSALPWYNPQNGRAYAAIEDHQQILQSSRKIILSHETNTIELFGRPITDTLEAAEQVFFLGFGFDPANMKKLGLDQIQVLPPKYFGASGVGLSERRKSELRARYSMCFYETIDEIFDQYDFKYVPSKSAPESKP